MFRSNETTVLHIVLMYANNCSADPEYRALFYFNFFLFVAKKLLILSKNAASKMFALPRARMPRFKRNWRKPWRSAIRLTSLRRRCATSEPRVSHHEPWFADPYSLYANPDPALSKCVGSTGCRLLPPFLYTREGR
jgi:hypothetical protein